MATDVAPAFLVVPDGVRGSKLRLSIQITPQYVAGGSLSLADWPSTVAAMLASLRFHLGNLKGDKTQHRVKAGETFVIAPLDSKAADGASDLWKAIFPDPGLLLDALQNITRDQAPPEVWAQKTLPIAPRVDMAFLEQALLQRRSRRARTNLGRLSGKKGYAALSREELRAELQTWAIPAKNARGSHDDGGNDVTAVANRKAVALAVAAEAASAPWRQYDHSHARLDAIHTAAMLKGRYDPDLAKAVAVTRPDTAAALLRSRLQSVQDSAVIGPVDEPKDEDTPFPWAEARRKLAAIQAFPTIARYLGMIVDFEILESDWEGGRYGVIAAGLDAQAGPDATWTAFANLAPANVAWGPSGSSVALKRYFGPCDIDEAFAMTEGFNQELVRGLVNLQQTGANGARYDLAIVDVVNSVQQDVGHAHSALGNGNLDLELPDLSARGIALVDADASGAQARQVARDKHLLASTAKVHFAADLLRGFKPSIGVAKPGTAQRFPAERLRWRSLVDRSLTYHHDGLKVFADARDVQREVGFVQRVLGEQVHHDRNTGAKTLVTLSHQDLFVWTGDSLAVATRNEESAWQNGKPPAGEVEIPTGEDLPLGITFSLPKKTALGAGLPPLREGVGYFVGLSASFVNGCGLSVDEAAEAHAAASAFALGERQSGMMQPFVFTRVSRIPAPVVLLPDEDEPLVTRKDISILYGEGLMTMVLRDGDFAGPANRKRAPRRYFFPERIAFDRAEQQRQFDAVSDPVPKGAFSDNRFNVRRDQERGTFPLAIAGTVAFPGPNANADADQPARGAVMQVISGSTPKVKPYYPDAYTLGLTAFPNVLVPRNSPPAPSATAAFRAATDPAIKALPAILELRPPRKPLPPGQRVRILLETEKVDGIGPRLNKVVVELDRATVVDIDLAPHIDALRFASGHFLRAALSKEGKLAKTQVEALASGLQLALAKGLWRDAQGPQKLRLVHARQKPLVPQFTARAKPKTGLSETGIGAVLLSDHAIIEPGANPDTAWDQYVRAHAGKPLGDWTSNPGGATCFFVGSVLADGPSTGTLNCDAYWQEFGPEHVRLSQPDLEPGSDRWDFNPPFQRARMFSIADLSSELKPRGEVDSSASASDRTPITLVDLTRNGGALRRNSYSFPDGRARKLNLDLVAVSRFTDYYPPVVLETTADKKNRPKESKAETRTLAMQELWVPCTFRPAPLDVRRVAQHFIVSGGVDRKQGTITFTRRTCLRVEIGPDGFQSGEDEKVALVFDAAPPADICEYFTNDRLRPFGQFVTRWGSDPIAGTPVPSAELSPCAFHTRGVTCDPSKLPEHPLYAGADPATGDVPDDTVPIKAKVLAFALQFDAELGSFYADIPLEQDSVDKHGYRPFIQLGLSRYQPHAVEGHELSLPVGKQVQPLAPRSGTIRFKGKDLSTKFKLKVTGPVPAAKNHWLEISLMKRPTADPTSWLPVKSIDLNRFISWRLDNPTSDGWETPDWLDMRITPIFNDLGLLIEEYEPIEIPDRSTQPPGKIISKRMVFGHLIDFQDYKNFDRAVDAEGP